MSVLVVRRVRSALVLFLRRRRRDDAFCVYTTSRQVIRELAHWLKRIRIDLLLHLMSLLRQRQLRSPLRSHNRAILISSPFPLFLPLEQVLLFLFPNQIDLALHDNALEPLVVYEIVRLRTLVRV